MTDPSNWRVLLIDDEEDIREVVSIILADAGYQVDTAVDGLEGMDICRRFSPHIVITDIRMPRMDGIEVLESLKTRYPKVEVIVATAFAEMDLAIKALQLDASDFITKPIHNEALMVALDRAQQRHKTRRRLEAYTQSLETGWAETTQELMETYAYQRKLIESSMDGIVGCDAGHRVVTFNRSMEKMSGFTKKDVLNKWSLAEIFDPSEAGQVICALEGSDYGGPGNLLLYEAYLRHRSGARLPVQVSATPLMEGDKTEGLVCFVRDLRQLRRLEQEMADQARILHQDKMMSLGRLAASVAHEINNPLSGILNYLRLMGRVLQRGQPDQAALDKFAGYLETVTTETDRCSRIVSNLLTFSRKSTDQKSPVDIKDLLDRSIVLSRHRMDLERIELKTRISPRPMTVMGDMNQLQQCIINLVFNAIDAMDDGGRLEIAARPVREKEYIEIQVIDSGCGISPDQQAHIFEPFFTTKAEGHGIGLGLSTVFGIIQHHEGKIDLESAPGEGSTFTIHLPATVNGK